MAISKRNKIIIGACGLALLIGFAATRNGPPVAVKTAKVEPQDVTLVLAVTGRLEPLQEAAVSSTLSALQVSDIKIDLGSRVKKGQVLIQLDTSDYLSQLSQAKAALAIDVENLRKARLTASGAQKTSSLSAESMRTAIDLKSARDQARDNLKVSVQRVASAQSTLEKVKLGGRPEEVLKAQNAIRIARSSLDLKIIRLNRAKELFNQGYIPKADLDQAQFEFDTAQQDLSSAQSSLILVRVPRQEDIEVAQAALAQAKASLALDQNNYRNVQKSLDDRLNLRSAAVNSSTEAASTNAAVRIASAQIQKDMANVQQIQSLLNRTRLVSPIDGVVSRRNIFTGETAQPGAELLRITSYDRFRAVADVDEKYVQQLSPGQVATLKAEAFPDLLIRAKIDSISREVNTAKGTVLVRFTLDNVDPRLRADLTLDINIETQKLRKAVVLPVLAVGHDSEGDFVLSLNQGKAERTRVTTGKHTGGGIVISDGLLEGALVVADVSKAKAGQSVKAQESQ